MLRAFLERRLTLREWRQRHALDQTLEPGRFRKGRTAHGCPRRCEHCRQKKSQPTRRDRRTHIALEEFLRDLYW